MSADHPRSHPSPPADRTTLEGACWSRSHRSIFISDVHLGTRDCKAELLLSFLERHPCEHLYLVGDIVDLWSLRRTTCWTAAQRQVLEHILRESHRGTQVSYVCGNHDESLRDHVGMTIGPIRLCNERVHRTKRGKRLLVLHGDVFDAELRCGTWRALLGDWAYVAVLRLNNLFHAVTRRLGWRYWSLANAIKGSLPQANRYIARFEELARQRARDRTYDGIVCGHIHKAQLTERDGTLYANCGDWVESCTAIAETWSGDLELLRWNGPPAGPGSITWMTKRSRSRTRPASSLVPA